MDSEDQEFQKQYTPSMWSPTMSHEAVLEKHMKLIHLESVANKEKTQTEENVQYGKRKVDVLDIFAKGVRDNAPILVYIHGGYWQMLSKDQSNYPARPLVQNGIKLYVPEYELAPRAKIGEIIDQIQTCASYVLQTAADLGVKSVWFCGHSAGAHLAASLLDEKWLYSLHEGTKNIFQGLILISGLYDLQPVVRTTFNDIIGMSNEDAFIHGPINKVANFKSKQLVRDDFKTLIAVGEHDPPAFQDQSKMYYLALNDKGMDAEFLLMPGLDHFDIVINLKDEDYVLTRRIIAEIKDTGHRSICTCGQQGATLYGGQCVKLLIGIFVRDLNEGCRPLWWTLFTKRTVTRFGEKNA